MLTGLALIGAYFLGPVAANEQALLELSRLKLTPDTGVSPKPGFIT